MTFPLKTAIFCFGLSFALVGCGGIGNVGSIGGGNSSAGGSGSLGGSSAGGGNQAENNLAGGSQTRRSVTNPNMTVEELRRREENGTIWDLFRENNTDEIGSVNRYLWRASLDVLSFLPVESADPFTGVLVFGYGRAPGSSASYRATVVMTDPGLDARSLKVSVQSRSGAVSAETQRQIENAILNRARQLRIQGATL